MDTSALLGGIADHLTEAEVQQNVEEAVALLASCGLAVEADSVEEFAEALCAIEEGDLLEGGLDEVQRRAKAGLLQRIGRGILKGVKSLGKAHGAVQRNFAQVRDRGRQRIAAVKSAPGKAFGTVKRAYSSGQKQGKLKPGEKMVFGQVRKVGATPKARTSKAPAPAPRRKPASKSAPKVKATK